MNMMSPGYVVPAQRRPLHVIETAGSRLFGIAGFVVAG